MRFFVIFIILTILLLGCSEKPEIEENRAFKIVDMSGREVEFIESPKKAVFLAGESWIYALGIKEKVVAVSDNAKLNPIILKIDPKISEFQTVGDMNRINEEAIISLNPDVIVVWDEPPGYKENAKKLERLGIPIVRIGYINEYPEDICKQAKLLGKIFNAEKRAEEICNSIEKRWKEISSKREERVEVIYSFTSPTYIACYNNYALFIEAVGGKIVHPKECNSTWIHVSKEWIVEENPQIWIISYFAKYDENAILRDPAFSDVEAVKRNAVYKESFKPMQFLEPYFLLTMLEYRSWILGDVDLEKEEEELMKEIYR